MLNSRIKFFSNNTKLRTIGDDRDVHQPVNQQLHFYAKLRLQSDRPNQSVSIPLPSLIDKTLTYLNSPFQSRNMTSGSEVLILISAASHSLRTSAVRAGGRHPMNATVPHHLQKAQMRFSVMQNQKAEIC